MRIPFRQGIVRAPLNFLQLSSGKVNLSISSPDAVLVTFADGAADYLITERASVANAWAGPFSAGSQSYWLYWDLNLVTGQKTYGHTLLEPAEGSTAPSTPMNDQHWFDTSVNKMKVWNATAGRWIPKVRTFAAQLNSGSVFVSMSINSPVFTGTQVGNLQSQAVEAGALVFDADGAVVKHTNGTFLTTEDVVLTGIASSSHVKFGSIVVEAEATGNIPAYGLVRFTDFNKVSVVTNFLIDNSAYGIVDTSASPGDVVNITMEGLITNPAWDWTSAGINAALYVDNVGNLTTTVPATPIAVAAVVDKNTILLRPSSLFLNTANDAATTTNMGAVQLSVDPANPQHPVAVGDNDPRVTGTLAHISDSTVHLTPTQNTFLDGVTSVSGGVIVRKGDGTGIARVLVAPAAGISISNVDGDVGNPTFALSNDLAAVEGLGATGLAARTNTDTWATRQIVVTGSASGKGISVTNGDGVAGNPSLALSNDVAAIEALTGNGVPARIDVDTWALRQVTSGGNGISVTNPMGVAGDITIAPANDLAAIEALAGTGFPVRTAAETWATRTLVGPAAGISLSNADGIAGNPTIALANDLAAVENISTVGLAVRSNTETWKTVQVSGQSGEVSVTNGTGAAAGDVIVGLSAVGTPVTSSFVKITTDAKGRVTATTAPIASDVTTALGYTPVNKLGDSMSGPLNMGGQLINNIASPVGSSDAANKSYVDSVASGLDPKGSVRAASTTNLALTGTQVVDGVSLLAGDRVLLRAQTDATQNGIWVVAAGSWARAADGVPGTTLTAGAYVFVTEGAVNANSGWVLATPDPLVLNSTSLSFQQFSGAGQITAGAGMTKTGNTLDVGTASSSRIVINADNIDLATGVATPGTFKSVTVDTYGRVTSGTNPTTLSTFGITDGQPLNGDLTAVSGMSTYGLTSRTAAGTWTTRTLTGIANQVTVTTGDGVAGNPSIGLASNAIFPGTGAVYVPQGITAQQGSATNGGVRYDTSLSKFQIVENGAWVDMGTVRSVAAANPGAGITLTPSVLGSTVTITTALANDLAGVEGLSTTGFAVRTAADTWATRVLGGSAGRIVVNNGSGATTDPSVDLASGVIGTPGTYKSVTVDTYGRITAGTNPTTLAGYGVTDAQPLSTNLTNFVANVTTGILAQTGAGTYASRTLQAPAAGLTITNPTGAGGDPTFTFANDLGAIEALSSTGFAVRTAADTWAQRQLTGAVNRVTVTNGTGASADPLIDIAATYVGQASLTTLGTITTGVWNATAITPTYGGTGTTALGTSNQILGVNNAGSAGEYKTLNGTTNQVTVSHAANSVTFALPQSINTTAAVQFSTVQVNAVRVNIASLVSGATINWDMSTGTHATITLGTNATLANPTNMPVGGSVINVKVVQDGTGTRTLAYGTAFKFVGGTAPVVSAGANQVSILHFWCDGTNLYEMSRALNVA